jgi:hypothetical protein
MAVSPEPRFVPGVWGPYFSTMVPVMWLTEGGQSRPSSVFASTELTALRRPSMRAEAPAGPFGV